MNFRGKILLVDDEPHIRVFVSLILKSLGGPKIYEATNGDEAVIAYQRDKPDVVLLAHSAEYQLPHQLATGRDVLKKQS